MSHDTENELDRVRRIERFQAFGLTDPDEVQRLLSTIIVGDGGDDGESVKRTRKRKPSVASVIRQMKRAGVEVVGCEINPRDGPVELICGQPVQMKADDDRNEWDSVLQ